MTTIHKVSRGNEVLGIEVLIITKGATETILQRCNRIKVGHKIIDVNNEHKQKVLQSNSNLASQGLRVIGVSFKEDMCDNVVRSSNNVTSTDNSSQNNELPQFVEHNMIFLGLVALVDPPKEASHRIYSTVQKCGHTSGYDHWR